MRCIISLVSIILESIRESQLKLVVVCVCVCVFTFTCTKLLFEKIQDNSYKIIAHQFLPFLSLKLTFPFSQANSLHCTIT